jgi:hypothetical protein
MGGQGHSIGWLRVLDIAGVVGIVSQQEKRMIDRDVFSHHIVSKQ